MLAELLYEITGYSLFHGRLFRAGAASITSILLVFIFMPILLRWAQKVNASSDFTEEKSSAPPILGGILLVPVVLFSTLCFTIVNSYVLSILVIMVAFFSIGAVDDFAKIWTKRKIMEGKEEKKSYQDKADGISARLRLSLYFFFSLIVAIFAYKFIPGMNGHISLPFIKPDVWYPYLPNWAFIILICLVITSTANGANFTDGLDSLVSIPLMTTALFVGVVAYISGNTVFSKYFLIPYLPGVDELFPLCAAMIGALAAYLWFNSPPAQVYMGDSGSIGFGGAIGMMFVLIKAEFFMPIVGFVFLMEALSVFFQIGWFKITKNLRADKQGQRLFLRAPLHHHFQMLWKHQYPNAKELNSKIVWRFHLVSLFALVLGSLIFFKIR